MDVLLSFEACERQKCANISEACATLYDIKQFSVNSRAENSKIVLNFTGDTKLTFNENNSELMHMLYFMIPNYQSIGRNRHLTLWLKLCVRVCVCVCVCVWEGGGGGERWK